MRCIRWFAIVFAVLGAQFLQAQETNATEELGYYYLENQVVVTVTRSEVKLKEAPAAVYVITDKDIRERGYRTLSEALHDVPGFDFQHTYGTFPEVVHQRGLVGNNQRSLLYIDGVPDNNISENAMLAGSLRFPLHNVKRIEILAGPASALYGANAFNGIINVIMNDQDQGSEVALTGGSYNNSFTNLGGALSLYTRGRAADVKYSLSGYYYNTKGPDFRNVQNLDAQGKGYYWSPVYDNSKEDTYNISAKFTKGNLRFQTVNWQYLQGLGTFANATQSIDTTAGGVGGSAWDFRSNSFALGYINEFTKQLSLDSEVIVRHTDVLSSSHDQTAQTGKEGPTLYQRPGDLVYYTSYSRPDYAYEVREKLTYNHSDRANTTLGFEVNHSVVPTGYGATTRYDYQNYGTYIQQVYKPIGMLALTGGYRFDHNTISGNSHTPRLGAVLSPVEDLTFKLLASTGFRAPTAWELFNATSNRLANTGLRPERLMAFELGAGYRLKKKYYFGIQSYYNRITSLLLEVQTSTAKPTTGFYNQNQNVGNAEIIGVEFQSDLQLMRDLNVFANYTYTTGRYFDLPATIATTPATAAGDRMPNIAPHHFNVGTTYYLMKDLSLHMRVNYVHERETIAMNPVRSVPGYILLHANIRWENVGVQGFYLQLMVRNLFNQLVFDPGIRTADGGYYPTQHPLEGRSIWLTAGYKF
ncbi:TonB-dependent receptor plug domain-containing protein [Turneriella parva]|uniref:TonB-dependent receptor n=1 Tax=Turneriella parva (strain ATCC BAA-1111 / DSM 21527 / NCTC 11395 / H) TaxID=869212 RepID=I4B1Y7_TURPD|nr:TonB-dependent receptor [Turneriella parva]AFM11294.1 TonB-dependent receptor [Turneriella parva DSM 21527]